MSDPYKHDTHHPDTVGGPYRGDHCPYCGDPLKGHQEVVNEQGESGKVLELAPEDVTTPLWCPECWEEIGHEVKRKKNNQIDDYV